MCGRLVKLFNKGYKSRKRKGFTLVEVIIASALLLVAVVPILKALTGSYLCSNMIDHKTTSLVIAQSKLDEIKARSIYNYGESFMEISTDMGDSYYCTVLDVAVYASLRRITVWVGYDDDGSSTLTPDEVLVALDTLLAERL